MFKVAEIKHDKFYLKLFAFCFLLFTFSSCGVYSFKDVSIPPEIKTIRIGFIENRASYVNPQLSPNLTDRVKQKINNQTRLTQVNTENAHYDVQGFVSRYDILLSGVANQQSTTNRISVTVHITLRDQLNNSDPQEFDVTRNFEFGANISVQTAEAGLLNDMVRDLSDEIFNRLFSNW
jgi:outer membrane lipopolysaccharide assembly protein LptE/RlpB